MTLWKEMRYRLRQRVRRFVRPASLGTLHSVKPLSDHWGFDRGLPVDRYYIEGFLEAHRGDICRRVLEVGDSRYTDRFGSSIERKDILDIDPLNPRATIVCDLSLADSIPSDQFDCILMVQTLQYIYDVRAAVAEAYRILRPGGVLLATVPALQKIDLKYPADYWRFTTASCSRLFCSAFGADEVSIRSYGNVLTSMAFLTGMVSQDLSRRELEFQDALFPVCILIRAVKKGGQT